MKTKKTEKKGNKSNNKDIDTKDYVLGKREIDEKGVTVYEYQ